ncbi:MAG: hypothetical protein AVO35_10915 [Candidatus Aegiribacteria sp. MLS_C]|nr:MAG: hypothetical protein AVO35_10915 [Candidatus Aegiribacteria sp. MLS_C]
MSCLLLFLCTVSCMDGGLLVVRTDIRELAGQPLPEGLYVLHISNDWFLAVGDPEGFGESCQLLDSGPVDLEDYSLVHLRVPDDTVSASAVGEVVFCRGRTAVVRRGGCVPDEPVFPGVHMVQPLRVYSERAMEPYRSTTESAPEDADTVDEMDRESASTQGE